MSATIRDLLVYLRERYSDAEPALAELDALEAAAYGVIEAVKRGHEHEVDEAVDALTVALAGTQESAPSELGRQPRASEPYFQGADPGSLGAQESSQ